MRIHPEGQKLLLGLALLSLLLILAAWAYIPDQALLVMLIVGALFVSVLQFFRNPVRDVYVSDNRQVLAPADGKVVVIEEVTEPEYFMDKRLMLSIFMSPTNVHVNRSPISGIVNYFKYHPGKYLVAWHPKSSTENERATTVISNGSSEVLMRQIAGAMARRIKNYLTEGDEVEQGNDIGFIKFGSRVDLFLPLNSELQVEMGQKVKGNLTVLATLPE